MKFRLVLDAWRTITRKMDPARSRLNRRTRFSYWRNALLQTALNQVQHKSHEDAIQASTPLPPVFILGFWRSGTTFLHEMLCSNPEFGFPSTYACLNPSHFLLSESWSRGPQQKQAKRPMDEMRYSWASPQEDEFALLDLGAPSPYEVLLAPSLMHQPDQLLDLRTLPASGQNRWADTLLYFLKLLTIQQRKPMVLKSPSHGFRLPFLRRLLPAARYLIIERNPYEVFASNLKLWRSLINQYSLEIPSFELLDDFILQGYRLHESMISEARPNLAAGSLASVRYEDLMAQPLEQMERVYSDLRIADFPNAPPHLGRYLSRVAGHRRNKFEMSRTHKARVDNAWGEIIHQKKYDWPTDYITLKD